MTYVVALTSVDRPVVLTYEPEGMPVIGRTDYEDTAVYLADKYISKLEERARQRVSSAALLAWACVFVWAVARYLA